MVSSTTPNFTIQTIPDKTGALESNLATQSGTTQSTDHKDSTKPENNKTPLRTYSKPRPPNSNASSPAKEKSPSKTSPNPSRVAKSTEQSADVKSQGQILESQAQRLDKPILLKMVRKLSASI